MTSRHRLFDEAEAHADDSAQGVIEKVAVPAHERKKRGRKPPESNYLKRSIAFMAYKC